MLNILYATTSTSLSGGTRQLINNAMGMAEAGHKITVCCFPGAALIQELTGIENIALATIQAKSLWGRLSFFRHLLVGRNIHVVHCFHNNLYKYFLFLRFLCPPFKLFLNRGVIFAPGSFPLLYLPQLTGVICNSGAAVDVLKKYHVPLKKLHVVYNAVIPPRQQQPDLSPRQEDHLTVLYIGNKSPYKGLDIFLQTVARIVKSGRTDMRYIVAGVSRNQKFETIVPQSILDRIEFKGGLPHKKIFNLLSQSNIFVITSRQESMPNTLLEAYAAGIPVVATAVGGIPEILTHGINGFLCTPNDVSAIAKNIEYLAENRKVREKISLHNQKTFCETFSLHSKIKNLSTIYLQKQ